MNTGMRQFLTLLIGLAAVSSAMAQRPQWSKLSPMLRQEVREGHQQPLATSTKTVCAFVKTTDASVLTAFGCKELTRLGDISIAHIPVHQLAAMSLDSRVVRMEARPMGHVLMDSVTQQLNAGPAHEGSALPQAFTGKDVVVGMMDLGFDLTHPNFYDRSATDYRIRRLWDMLSIDTIGSPLPVGRDYVTTEALLTLAHSRDGLDQPHGTHTLGSAATRTIRASLLRVTSASWPTL